MYMITKLSIPGIRNHTTLEVSYISYYGNNIDLGVEQFVYTFTSSLLKTM